MTAEIKASVEKVEAEWGDKLIGVSWKQGNRGKINYFWDKESALEALSQSRTACKIHALLSGGITIGFIAAGLGILLKDPNIGEVQIAASITAIGFGIVGAIGFVDTKEKSEIVDKQISAVENYTP